jgi:hypothetical protein
MRLVRLMLCPLALVLVLLLSACGSTVASNPSAVSRPTSEAQSPTPQVAVTQPVEQAEPTRPPILPAYLIIPAIGLNARIEPVGVQPDGDLATPPRDPWDDVGWDDLGPAPGQQGSAVIDGHLDRPGGYPAVFWNLRDLQVGDVVQVINTVGKALQFRVTLIAYYPPDEAPIQDIFGNQSGTYLNLITCAGDWIPSQHQTTLRLVVYTTLV